MLSVMVAVKTQNAYNKKLQPPVYTVSICVHARKLTFSHTNRHRIHRDWTWRSGCRKTPRHWKI